MTPLLHSMNFISATVVAALFSAVWQGSILAACVAICLRAMPRLSAAARSVVWLNVFLVLIVLHALPAILNPWSSRELVQPSPVHLDPRWSLAIAALWALLSLWKAMQLAASAVRVHRLASRAIPVEVSDSLKALLNNSTGQPSYASNKQKAGCPILSLFSSERVGDLDPRPTLFMGSISTGEASYGLDEQECRVPQVSILRPGKPRISTLFMGSNRGGRTAEFCTSGDVERPSVLGFFRPRILFPAALLESLTEEEIRQVVVHEMEHLNRGDDWTNLLQKICLVLFPLNPALLWVERRLCQERELACDDRVLSSCGWKAYAICLTRLAEYTLLHRGLTLVLGAWERRPELVRRVHRILRRPMESLSPHQAMAATAGLSVAALALAAGLARTPQMVSFAPASNLQAHALPSPDLQPVNLRGSDSLPRPQLVKAVMPAPAGQAPTTKRIAALRRRTKRPAQPIRPPRQAWVVLTDWDDFAPPPRVVIAVDQLNRPSFAAVQFANGWLIVQI